MATKLTESEMKELKQLLDDYGSAWHSAGFNAGARMLDSGENYPAIIAAKAAEIINFVEKINGHD